MFAWWRRRRRRKILSEQIPEEWHDILERYVEYFSAFTDEERKRFIDIVHVIVDEKYWEGCNGFEMNDEVKVVIAAQAALIVLGMHEQYYDNVKTILVYPTSYVAQDTDVTEDGFEIEVVSNRFGEAWYRGPVVLSWQDVIHGGDFEEDGRNLVFHEFAHKLDFQNGKHSNGTPPLEGRVAWERWQNVVGREYRELVEECSNGRRTFLDCYGATNEAEFFAVATEHFFEQPGYFEKKHPELFEVFCAYYVQNPLRLS